MTKTKTKKPYWNMTADELAQATRDFDREHVAESFRDMTPAEEKAWREGVMKPRRSRSLRPRRAGTVAVEVQAKLLKRVDALAKKRGISRARLVAETLEAMLAKKGA